MDPTRASSWPGLLHSLKIERKETGRIEECKTEMLSAWLLRKDGGVEEALPLWSAHT